MKIEFPLFYGNYSLTIKREYCGAIAHTKTPMDGEDWIRSRDLRDGKLTRLPLVLWDIVCWEMKWGRWSVKNNPSRPCRGSSATSLLPPAALLLLLVLVSCAPYMDLNRGIVHGGFMSSTQAFSGKMRSVSGSTATWSIIGTDSTAVPIAITNAVETVGVAKYTFKGVESNNNVKNVKSNNGTKEVINGQNTALEGKKIDANGKQFDTAVGAGAQPSVGTVQPQSP